MRKLLSDKGSAIALILSSAFFFSTMSALVRLAGPVPVFQKFFIRNVITVLIVGATLAVKREPFHFHRDCLPQHFLRSLCGFIGAVCNFYAVDHMIISDATMIAELSPFFVILFSAVFLHEKASVRQYSLIILALIGAAFVIKPSAAILTQSAAPYAVVTALSSGIGYMFVRALGLKGEHGPVIVMFFALFSCVACVPFMMIDSVKLTSYQLLMLILAGASACCAQFCVTAGYRRAPASEVSIFDYGQILFAALYGWVLFGEIADIYSFIGYAIIVLSAVMMSRADRRCTQ